MTYATNPVIGVDITETTSSTADFNPGMTVNLSDGGVAIYIKASAAITTGDVLQIGTDGAATPITTALCADDTATAAKYIGVAVVDITSAQYGWARLKGAVTINVAASVGRGDPLYTTTTAGRVSATASSSHLIDGLMLTTDNGGTAAVVAGIASNPVLARGTHGA